MKPSAPIIRIGVISIGDELLKGFTINTNLSDIGQRLLSHGFILESALVIKDNGESIKEALGSMIERGMDIIITTGGLGPTVDDLTKKAISEYAEISFVKNEKVVDQLRKYWAARSQPMPEAVLNQAMVLEGSSVFPNEVGTAPGLKVSMSEDRSDFPYVILLPGPPREMKPMFENYVIPYLNTIKGFSKSITETIFVTGIPESKVEEAVLPLIRKSDLELAICASPEAVKIYISGFHRDKLMSTAEEIRGVFGDKALPQGITSPVENLVNYCLNRNITISTAESCTGGMISSAITDFSGISEIYKGSIISYSNEWKQNLLGVSEETLKNFGAVSRESAEEMVLNLCDRYNTDAGISVTGIAGPGGGTDEKPVGLVFIGAKYKKRTLIEKFIFPGTRKSVRTRTLHAACRLLKDLMHSVDQKQF